MVNIISDDIDLGVAGDITFEAGRLPRIGGLWVMGYSVDRAQAYGEHPATKGAAIAYWSLTAEQIGLLLARAPARRLASEVAEDRAESEREARRMGKQMVDDGLTFAEAGAVVSQQVGGFVDPAEAAAVLATVQPELEPALGAGEAATQALLAVFRIAEARRRAAGG